jgi:hypothetical protein
MQPRLAAIGIIILILLGVMALFGLSYWIVLIFMGWFIIKYGGKY